MTRFVRSYVASCAVCQRTKPSSQASSGLLHPHAVPPRPWAHVAMDLITDLPRSVAMDTLSYDSICTFTCMLTKQAIFVKTVKTVTSQQLAHLFLEYVFSKHGLPDVLVSDRDPRFTSGFWSTLFEALDTKQNLSSSYHPETDGQSERTNRHLEQILRAFVNPLHDDWAKWLPMAEFSFNSSLHASIKVTPFEANLGFIPKAPADVAFPVPTTEANSYLDTLKLVQSVIKQELELAKACQAAQADRRRRPLLFRVGDVVI